MMVVRRTLETALLEAWANRSSFYTQVTFMIVNDLVFVAFWLLFYGRVGEVRGWDASRTLVLMAILATVTGIALGLCANARRMGEIISAGELDAVLPLPVDPLGYLLVRRIETALLGDLLFGPVLFFFFGRPTIERTAVFVFVSLCGAAVLVSFLLALGSLTFFLGGRGEQTELGFQAILILSAYPIDLFTGIIKIVMFTAVPAAFVSGLPARLVDDFSWGSAAVLLVVTAVFVLGARALFSIGLRGYRSGASWSRA
jgi:ABC-2 type transport system permease protein